MKLLFAVWLAAICVTPGFGGDKMIRFHGKPIFMIGVYNHPSYTNLKEALEDLANAGFNTLLVPPNTEDQTFQEMERLGIMAVVALGETMVLWGDEPSIEAKKKSLTNYVTRLKNNPALLGWEGPDEPLWNWKWSYQYPQDKPTWELPEEAQKEIHAKVDALKAGYALVKSLSPEHPVFLNFAPRSTIEELRWFTSAKAVGGYRSNGQPAADAFGVDIYPVPAGGGNNGPVKGVLTPSIAAVGRFTEKQREVAGEAPIYLVIQGCGILDWDADKEKAQRHPTFHEERFMAFQAVANGANGILWWGTNYISADSELWNNIKRVARQLKSLSPILAEGESAPVKCSSPYVELTRRVWKGHSYVIAVNASDRKLDNVTIGWDGLKGTLKVLFEERSIVSERERLRDEFAPFDVHIYSDDFSSSVSVEHKVKCAFGLPLSEQPFKDKSYAEIASTLREMGIEAVCGVPEDKNLIRALRLAGIRVYAEMGMFVGKQHWESHPESRPINEKGEPIGEPVPGYCGVCPNQDWLKKEILDKVSRKFAKFEYDGLWLDFIRYPGRWEHKPPTIEQCCFCDVCLARFAKWAGVEYPRKLRTNAEKAKWILENYPQQWTEFKCAVITDFVGEVKATMRRQNPNTILGIFNVPWTISDFDGAVLKILGQDITRLAEHVEVFSPMVYHRFCGFPLRWVEEYTNYAWEKSQKPIWPIVQVCDEPEGTKMSPDEVFQTFRAGLDAYGSSGIMMFAFGHLTEDPEKLKAMEAAYKRK